MFNKKRLECWHSQLMQLRQNQEEMDKRLERLEVRIHNLNAANIALERRVELTEQFMPDEDSYALIGTAGNYYHGKCWTAERKKEDYTLKAYLPTCGQELWVKKSSEQADKHVSNADIYAIVRESNNDISKIFSRLTANEVEIESLRMSHDEQAEILTDLRNVFKSPDPLDSLGKRDASASFVLTSNKGKKCKTKSG